MTALRDAISFLTIVPFPCPLVNSDPSVRMCRALLWFPVVGAFIGAVGTGMIFLASKWWPSSIAAFLGLAGMVILTGGLHLDGFADSMDGLAAWKNREATLQVMRDSRIGALGAAGLFLLLGLKWALIESIPIRHLAGTLILVCASSRWAMVLSAQLFPYVPGKTGLGRLVTDRRSHPVVWMTSLLAIGIVFLGRGPLLGLLAIAFTGVVIWMLNRLFVRRLGGITGDTLGAVNEVVEVGLLLLLASWPWSLQ